MITQEQSLSIMERLKASTQSQHDATEDGTFNQELVKGKLPLEKFVDSLGQLLLIHAALEQHLRRLRYDVPAFEKVLRDYQFQEPYLRSDLEFFGRVPEQEQPLPATRRFIEYIDQLAAQSPMGLLGVHYVFEGSNNGSKYISRAVRKAYNLSDGEGTHYLDPYGEQQKAYWQAFKDDMNAVGFLPPESEVIVKAACATFEAVMHLHRELNDAPARPNGKPADPQPAQQASNPAAGKCPFHHG